MNHLSNMQQGNSNTNNIIIIIIIIMIIIIIIIIIAIFKQRMFQFPLAYVNLIYQLQYIQ